MVLIVSEPRLIDVLIGVVVLIIMIYVISIIWNILLTISLATPGASRTIPMFTGYVLGIVVTSFIILIGLLAIYLILVFIPNRIRRWR